MLAWALRSFNTRLSIVSHYSDDLNVAVTRQYMLQCTSKGSEAEDCKLVYNIDQCHILQYL